MNLYKDFWQGRNDGDSPEHNRWFKIIQFYDNPKEIEENSFAIHGFCVDEGVRRNKGRTGAAESPDVLRKILSNFPVHSDYSLFDGGNIFCENQNLEKAQQELSNKVEKILTLKNKSIVIGGGHEVTYAHFKGIRQAFPKQKIGIINFDAHFDNREIDNESGATSGTGFWQIAQEEKINSLTIGIQKNSNTQKLFDTADKTGMKYILAEDLIPEKTPKILSIIDKFCENIDGLYVTVCMDVFSSAFAPGVSATAYNGIIPDYIFLRIFKRAIFQEKCIAFDVAEVNSKYDIDQRTAKLAASLVYLWVDRN